MINYKDIIDAQEMLVKHWGIHGERVIAETVRAERKPMTFTQFLDNCIACGGNWGNMLLTGIDKLWPNVWEAIPDDMGVQAWGCLCSVLVLCGVDTSE